jgi:glycine hydroxymethyltransferase
MTASVIAPDRAPTRANEELRQRFTAVYELGRQQERYERSVINMIASDNVVPAWRHAYAPYRGDMIQEGLVGERPFAGAEYHNRIEDFAAEIACEVFGAEHAMLQPHSCSQANQAVYQALLEPGAVVLSLDFLAGGHLTHGLRRNFSGRHYVFHHYGLGTDDRIDYAELARKAVELRPKLIVCGSSSYPWLFDFDQLRAACDGVGARLMLDLSHEAGLIAAHAIPSPLPAADVITMSLDKTLRGPHGGLILSRREYARAIDRAVHPGTQSSFPIRRLTDAATALLETQTASFRAYGQRTLSIAQAMAVEFAAVPGLLFGGGTAKHYLLLDVRAAFAMTGRAAEARLETLGLLANRQTLRCDASARMSEASGLRIGTAWMSSRGYVESDARAVAQLIMDALAGRRGDEAIARSVRELLETPRAADCLDATTPPWEDPR